MISVREEVLSLSARNRIDNMPKGRKSQFVRDAIEFYVEYLDSNVVMTKDVIEEIEKLKKEVAEIRCSYSGTSKVEKVQENKKVEKPTPIKVEQEKVTSITINSEEENLKEVLIKSIKSFVNFGEREAE
jgi:hypothetical protein